MLLISISFAVPPHIVFGLQVLQQAARHFARPAKVILLKHGVGGQGFATRCRGQVITPQSCLVALPIHDCHTPHWNAPRLIHIKAMPVINGWMAVIDVEERTIMKRQILAATMLVALAAPAFAQSQGEWTVGLGVANVNPKSDNGTLDGGLKSSIGSSTRPTITFEYFIRDNLGIEVLAALPFKHTIKLNGAEAGTVKHLPPVVSLQYHFDATPQFKPFVGVGVNYTGFWGEKTKGPLATTDLKVKGSWGLAAHVGADFWINEKAAIRADLRWIDIDSKVRVNGAAVGTVDIDPVVVGMSYIMKF